MTFMNSREPSESPLKRLSDALITIILLGFLFTVTSLGVVTVGASLAALNAAMRSFEVDHDTHAVARFFPSFRRYFKAATLVWLIHLLILAVLGIDLLYYSAGTETVDTLAMTAILVLLTLLVFELSVVFACMVEYEIHSVREAMKRAFDVAFRCFFESFEMLVLTLSVLLLGVFLLHGILIFAGGIIAFANWKILPVMFRKYHFRRLDNK